MTTSPRDVDLNDLVAFVRVAEAKSFTAAATALGVPKSTISRAVSRLEDAVGVRLLQRTTRTITLTGDGDALLQRAAPHVTALREAACVTADVHRELSGTVRFTAPHDFGVHFVSDVVTRFVAKHPEVRVIAQLTARVADLVAEGLDLAIRAGPLQDSSLVSRKIMGVRFKVYAAPSFVQKFGAVSTLEQLATLPAVLFRPKDGETTWDLCRGEARRALKMHGQIGTDDFSFLHACLVAGAGVGILPTFIGDRGVTQGTLVSILPEWTTALGRLSVVYPSTRNLPARVTAFRDFLIAYLSTQFAAPDLPDDVHEIGSEDHDD